MSPLFVSFANFRTVSKVTEKRCFGKKFCKFKILFEWEIYISSIPSNDYMNFKTVIFFSFTHTNSAFSSEILFSIASAFIQDFFPIKPTQQRSLSDCWKHKAPQSIHGLYMDCYFYQEHHKIA